MSIKTILSISLFILTAPHFANAHLNSVDIPLKADMPTCYLGAAEALELIMIKLNTKASSTCESMNGFLEHTKASNIKLSLVDAYPGCGLVKASIKYECLTSAQ